MSGIPQNVMPANVQDLVDGTVAGVTTQAQATAAEAISNATSVVGVGQAKAQEIVAQAQAKANEELTKLTNQLKLPQDALIALGILETIFSYEELAGLSIEEIKKRIKSAKKAFKLSRPELPEIPKLNIPSAAQLIDAAIPDIFPNDSGLDAYAEKLLDEIKALRQRAQAEFEKTEAQRTKNMFEYRKQLAQEESNRLLSQLTSRVTSAVASELPSDVQSVLNNLQSSV